MSELRKEMIKNGIHYTLHGDYYLPDLEVDSGYSLGKYGMARMDYLEEHRSGLYTRLLLGGRLFDDLHQADVQAQHLLDTMIPQMAKEAGVTEQLKNDRSAVLGWNDERYQGSG